MDYSALGINDEPEHNTNGVFCWCAPRIEGDVVMHNSLKDIITAATSRYSFKTHMGLPVIYIAGPYRADNEYQVRQNIRAAEEYSLFVWRAGGVALCPHKNTAGLGGACADGIWLRGDFELLGRCDALYAIPGWQKSKGAAAEVAFAMANSISVLNSPEEVQAFIQKDGPTLHSGDGASPAGTSGHSLSGTSQAEPGFNNPPRA